MRKRSFFNVLLVFLAFAACTKDDQSVSVNPKNLEGTWELRLNGGGMLPFDPATVRPGNGDQWRFSETEFGRYFKDTLFRTGKYTISRGTGTDPNTQRAIDQFIFEKCLQNCGHFCEKKRAFKKVRSIMFLNIDFVTFLHVF